MIFIFGLFGRLRGLGCDFAHQLHTCQRIGLLLLQTQTLGSRLTRQLLGLGTNLLHTLQVERQHQINGRTQRQPLLGRVALGIDARLLLVQQVDTLFVDHLAHVESRFPQATLCIV